MSRYSDLDRKRLNHYLRTCSRKQPAGMRMISDYTVFRRAVLYAVGTLLLLTGLIFTVF